MTSRSELVDYYKGFAFTLIGEADLPRGVRLSQMLRKPGVN
jgi:hypothetical protein